MKNSTRTLVASACLMMGVGFSSVALADLTSDVAIIACLKKDGMSVRDAKELVEKTDPHFISFVHQEQSNHHLESCKDVATILKIGAKTHQKD